MMDRDIQTEGRQNTPSYDTYKDTGTDIGTGPPDSVQAGTDSDSSDRQTEDRRHSEYEIDNSKMNLLLITHLQGEVLLFLSLIQLQSIVGNSELVTNAFSPSRLKY